METENDWFENFFVYVYCSFNFVLMFLLLLQENWMYSMSPQK